MSVDAQSFLMGGGVASAKFDSIGVTVGGRITEQPEMRQQNDIDTQMPAFWKDGNPKMQLVVTVQTDLRDPADPDDEGLRRFYVKANLQKAVAQAVRNAKAANLEVGGTLTVTYSGDGVKSNPAFSAPKLYTATYTPPSAAFLASEPDQSPAAQPTATTSVATDDAPPPGFPADAWAGLSAEARAALKAVTPK